MRKIITFVGLFACAVLLDTIGPLPSLVGQPIPGISGVPGDDIPDIYYFPTDGTVNTSLGDIDRPAGTLTVDTDGTDMVAVFVSGADVSRPPACDLCNNFNLPDPNAIFGISTWAVGFINDYTQWVRTFPLDTEGFVGVVGEHEKIFALIPRFGLANYGPDLGTEDFPQIFSDPSFTEQYSVIYVTHRSGTFYTNVTIVPEPNGWLLLLLVAPTVGIVRTHVVRET